MASGFSTNTCLPASAPAASCRHADRGASRSARDRYAGSARDRVEIGRRVGRSEPLGRAARRQAGAADDGVQLVARSFSFCRLGRCMPCAKPPAPTSASLILPLLGAGGFDLQGRLASPLRDRDISSSTSSGLAPGAPSSGVGLFGAIDVERLLQHIAEPDRRRRQAGEDIRPCCGFRSSAHRRTDSRRLAPHRAGRSGRGRRSVEIRRSSSLA